jgi:hypothetical protein
MSPTQKVQPTTAASNRTLADGNIPGVASDERYRQASY